MLAAVLAVSGLIVLVVGLGVGGAPERSTGAAAPVAAPSGPAAEGPVAAARPSLPPSAPTSLRIPSIGVDTGLDGLSLNPDNTVQVPEDFARAGWYTGAPTPGQIGPAVILGHIDSYRGPAVFYRVDQLRPGDPIIVDRADGRRAQFTVDSVREYAKNRFPTEDVYGATDTADLRLITCGGPFDPDARSYLNNVVVYAHLTSPVPATDPAQAPAAPTGPEGLTGPPTLYGRVVSVSDAATAVVEVQRRRITVSVVGLDTTGTPACARDQATAFARRMLTDRTVTLVPDPTLPADPASATWPAYLVLDTQQSYTDAAISEGWAAAGAGRYRPGFLQEQRQAQDRDAGMWGPPCNRPTTDGG